MHILKITTKRWAALAWGGGAACALLFSAEAHAQAGAPCRPEGTVAETNACAVQTYQQADTAIAILYSDVMRALSAHERPQLRQEQTAWQRQRTMLCKQGTQSTEGLPEWPRLYHACLTAETEARRQGLMRWLTLDHPSAKP